MKTFSTIFITGTIISSFMIMGNKEEFNIGGFDVDRPHQIVETQNPEEDLFNPELEINFDKLFLLEKEMELTLDQIEYIELEEEVIIEENEDIIEPELILNYDKLFQIEDEVVLTLDEIDYLEMEDEEALF